MGHRTVVLLNNDQASEWENDPALGRKIMVASVLRDEDFPYGSIVDSSHADVQRLIMIDSLTATTLATDNWYARDDDVRLKLLRKAAKSLGYKLIKDNKARKELV